MSQATLKVINSDGEVVDYKEYNNAWGGAAFIWTKIYDRYLKNPSKSFDSWLFNSDKLWKLSSDKTIPFFVRVILSSTFDYALIKKEDLMNMADYYKKFLEAFPPESNVICHLPQWIKDIEDISKNESYSGIGFHHTSVSEDLWNCYDDKKDEYYSYNINECTKHWYLFDEIEE